MSGFAESFVASEGMYMVKDVVERVNLWDKIRSDITRYADTAGAHKPEDFDLVAFFRGLGDIRIRDALLNGLISCDPNSIRSSMMAAADIDVPEEEYDIKSVMHEMTVNHTDVETITYVSGVTDMLIDVELAAAERWHENKDAHPEFNVVSHCNVSVVMQGLLIWAEQYDSADLVAKHLTKHSCFYGLLLKTVSDRKRSAFGG